MDAPTAIPVRQGRVVGGRFRLETRIGEGAVGEVWRATNVQRGSAVAVKLLTARIAGAHTEHHVHRFLEEAMLARRVDCAHVVRISECALSVDFGPYLVMDLIEGLDLFEYIARFGPMSPGEAAIVIAQLCVALEAMHSAEVFHRDVKPENVVLATRDARLSATLIDFGVALDGRGPVEVGGALIGTPAYMSPERLAASPSSPAAADMWALAVVAYQCLTARLPFDDSTVESLHASVASGVFVPPTAWRSDLPRRLDAWFGRALALAPAKRFATALAMREGLIEACAPFVLDAPKSSICATPSNRAGRTSGERPRLVQHEDQERRDAC